MNTWIHPDGIGRIEVLEVFGNDLTVVNAARVSFAKESAEFSTRDAGLIRYLATHHHTSPFFHPQIRLRIKMPLFVAREWFRHTVGFARNEVSRRYVDVTPELWFPDASGLRARDPKLKQGSKEEPVEGADGIVAELRAFGESTVALYESLLAAYARLFGLRTDPGAQREIQRYAQEMGALVGPSFPVSWAALSKDSVESTAP